MNQEIDRLDPFLVKRHGEPLARRLQQLDEIVGASGIVKFKNGKVAGAGLGQYMSALCDLPQYREFVCELLDALLTGEVVAVCNVDSYYRRGKVWPAGIQIRGGQIVDVWEE